MIQQKALGERQNTYLQDQSFSFSSMKLAQTRLRKGMEMLVGKPLLCTTVNEHLFDPLMQTVTLQFWAFRMVVELLFAA